jgi:hypothetical protein
VTPDHSGHYARYFCMIPEGINTAYIVPSVVVSALCLLTLLCCEDGSGNIIQDTLLSLLTMLRYPLCLHWSSALWLGLLLRLDQDQEDQVGQEVEEDQEVEQDLEVEEDQGAEQDLPVELDLGLEEELAQEVVVQDQDQVQDQECLG